MRHVISVLLHALAGVPLSALPHSWREAIEGRLGLHPGVAGGALSAAVQLALGLFVGVALFFGYLNDLEADTLAAVEAQLAADPSLGRDETLFRGMASLWLTPIHPFLFVLTTPRGLVALIVTAGGLVRTLTFAVASQHVPDPTLSVIEWLRRGLVYRAREHRRERGKGDWSPDQVVAGDAWQPWDLRIITAEDLDWGEGVGVLVGGVAHRVVGRGEIRDAQGRLRLTFDLKRLAGTEVLRGARAYRPSSPPARGGGHRAKGAA